MVSKREFLKVWKDTSKENILNQFYYEHKTLREQYDNWNELKKYVENELSSKYIHKYDVLDKMQELEGNNE